MRLYLDTSVPEIRYSAHTRIERVRLYLDTSVLASFTYFSETETARFEKVAQLLDTCIKNKIEIVVSFYSLHELFLLAFEYLK